MLKFIAQLFGKDYKTPDDLMYQMLKEQLEYERQVNKELVETLTSLVKPAPIIQYSDERLNQASPKPVVWSRQRAKLEREDRERAIKQSSPHLARPDKEVVSDTKVVMGANDTKSKIDKLEEELGLGDETSNEKGSELIMPLGAYTATITAKTGPGNSVTALVFTGVRSINFRYSDGSFDVFQEGKMTTFQYSDVATVTVTPASRTISIST